MTSLQLSFTRGTLESDVVPMSAAFLQILSTTLTTSQLVIVSIYVPNVNLHSP